MRAVCIVPARGGSTRVPRKNLARVGGKTLVRRALETVLASGCFDRVVLSSDDAEILAEAGGIDIDLIRRPPELATATARALDAVRHAVETTEAAHGRFDAFAIVQCTAPFTAPEDIAGVMGQLAQSGAASVVSVARVEAALHPLKLKVMDGDRLLPFLADDELTPSHDLPPLWARNGSVYASRRDVLARNLLVDPDDVRGYEMPPERSFDIDTPRDLLIAQVLSERGSS
jgi:CMP-N,N'-diacetyllegionaminic acid synthase